MTRRGAETGFGLGEVVKDRMVEVIHEVMTDASCSIRDRLTAVATGVTMVRVDASLHTDRDGEEKRKLEVRKLEAEVRLLEVKVESLERVGSQSLADWFSEPEVSDNVTTPVELPYTESPNGIQPAPDVEQKINSDSTPRTDV